VAYRYINDVLVCASWLTHFGHVPSGNFPPSHPHAVCGMIKHMIMACALSHLSRFVSFTAQEVSSTPSHCRYVQQNCISEISGLEALQELDTLNVSHNRLRTLSGLSCCPNLRTLIATNNQLASVDAIAHLALCASLHTLDLQVLLCGVLHSFVWHSHGLLLTSLSQRHALFTLAQPCTIQGLPWH
jgi:hypothetical protein